MNNLPQDPVLKGFLLSAVPHANALNMHMVTIESGKAVCRIPYSEELIGNPDTRVIHGGVITALLDNACGIAIGSMTRLLGQIATLDLRIDYMKSAMPEQDIFAFAECFKVTRNIAFARGIAYHTDQSDPIATCSAAFMLKTRGTPRTEPAATGAR